MATKQEFESRFAKHKDELEWLFMELYHNREGLEVLAVSYTHLFAVDRDSVQLTCSSWRGLRHKNSSFLFLRCPQARGRGSLPFGERFLSFPVKRYTACNTKITRQRFCVNRILRKNALYPCFQRFAHLR